ncbi:Carboxyl/Cholinesterase 09 [Frankliniella occidentalis]|nr:Carboxyl/Cholinesterase 09 [Frankliniella occidentalis]
MTPRQLKKRALMVGAVLGGVIFAAAFAAYFAFGGSSYEDSTSPRTLSPPEAKVTEGTLRGKWANIPDYSVQYAAFRGIPYAQPPVGMLRFKAPLPPAMWSGVRDATKEGSACMQVSDFAEIIGSEDCLYLNVYSRGRPNVSIFENKNVYWQHCKRRGTDFGPELFMRRPIVVVTINYRLNAFGFLNLDNDVVPGNAGIKDQIAALRWIHANIDKFGGDPSAITIGGQSTGAASAHWLTLLPESRGLVKRAILESGSALHSWAYHEDNIAVALQLGSNLSKHKDVSLEEVARLVMERPAAEILSATDSIELNGIQLPFSASPERRAPQEGGQVPLITQDPEKYILTDRSPVPILLGMNSREWLFNFQYLGYARSPQLIRNKINNLVSIFPKSVMPGSDTAAYLNLTSTHSLEHALDLVHQHFFKDNGADPNKTSSVFQSFLDDVYVGTDVNRLAELRVRVGQGRTQTYVYRFGVCAKYNTSPFQNPGQVAEGASNGDELQYLWYRGNQKFEGDGLASTTLNYMVETWSFYVGSGIPQPFTKWVPNEFRSKPGDVIYMNIGENVDVKEDPIAGQNAPFWLDLCQQYRDNSST